MGPSPASSTRWRLVRGRYTSGQECVNWSPAHSEISLNAWGYLLVGAKWVSIAMFPASCSYSFKSDSQKMLDSAYPPYLDCLVHVV